MQQLHTEICIFMKLTKSQAILKADAVAVLILDEG